MDRKKTGNLIADLRKKQGMTQQELADKLGVTSKAISRWETGRGYPDVEILPVLAETFSVSVDELLSGEWQKTEPESTYVPSYAKEGWRVNSGEKHDTVAGENPMEDFDCRIRKKGGRICIAVAGYWTLIYGLSLIFSFGLGAIISVTVAVLLWIGLCYCGYSWIRFIYIICALDHSFELLEGILNIAPVLEDAPPNMQDIAHLLATLFLASFIAIEIASIIILVKSESVKDYLYTRRTR